MTLSELAKFAHVSISTASKAFAMSKEVNEETRELIFSVAREKGCFKKFFNAKYPKYMVAIICPEIKSYTYSSLCLRIQQLLNEHNCEVCISTTEFSSEKAKERLAYYDKYSCADAVVLVDIDIDDVTEYIVPIVSIWSKVKNPIVSITMKQKYAMEQAINCFCEQGITDIVFVGEKLATDKIDNIKELFEKILGKATEDSVFIAKKRVEIGGYEAAKEIFALRNGDFLKAIICAYDNLAFGVIRFLKDNGVRVPEDVKIIGMDNILTTEYFSPRLSSIDYKNEEVAECVSKSIIDIFNGEIEPKEYSFTHDLVLRESSGHGEKTK